MALVNSRPRWWLAAGLVGLGLGCGDPLVDEAYAGTPRFRVQGSVTGTSGSVDVDHPELSVALFWVAGGETPGAQNVLREQPGTALRAEFYRSFELKLFDEPDAQSLLTAPTGARYGVARLGAYRDENGNGRRDETEPLLGMSNGRLLLRAPRELSAKESPTGARLAAGWYVASAPLECPAFLSPPTPPGGPGSTPVPTGECGVPLGVTCRGDAECGAGVCVREFLGPWPGGACAIMEPPPNGCRQRGSVLLTAPQDATRGYWLKSCETTADCGRAAPFQCDQQLRVCRPSADFPVELSDKAPPRSFCKPPAPAPPQGP
jgi:hypothetical protein